MGFMDDLNDMFNKSAAVAGDMLNKGASAAGRMADSANLRFKQGEIDRRWKDACAVGTNRLMLETRPAIKSPATVGYNTPFCSLTKPRAFSSSSSSNSKSVLSPS